MSIFPLTYVQAAFVNISTPANCNPTVCAMNISGTIDTTGGGSLYGAGQGIGGAGGSYGGSGGNPNCNRSYFSQYGYEVTIAASFEDPNFV